MTSATARTSTLPAVEVTLLSRALVALSINTSVPAAKEVVISNSPATPVLTISARSVVEAVPMVNWPLAAVTNSDPSTCIVGRKTDSPVIVVVIPVALTSFITETFITETVSVAATTTLVASLPFEVPTSKASLIETPSLARGAKIDKPLAASLAVEINIRPPDDVAVSVPAVTLSRFSIAPPSDAPTNLTDDPLILPELKMPSVVPAVISIDSGLPNPTGTLMPCAATKTDSPAALIAPALEICCASARKLPVVVVIVDPLFKSIEAVLPPAKS